MSLSAAAIESQHRVLVNCRGRLALWPATKSVPAGWSEVRGPGSRAECLSYVSRTWTGLHAGSPTKTRTIDFSLLFFGSDEGANARAKYEFVIDAARFADANGFTAIWLPERHFTRMGSLYPNPAVLHAALARETRHVRLRAGSVVMPLHQPLRVAEEWAVVDNVSGGRVEISFAPGWNVEDFALSPGQYATRYDQMYEGIRTVERLWTGASIDVVDGAGQTIQVRTYPTPVQKHLVKWITAAGSVQSFEMAGQIGANLLTHLFDQGVEELAEKIAVYQRARARCGFDLDTGRVAVALHTFLGASAEEVRAHAFEAYRDYLRANLKLLEKLAHSRNITLDLQSLKPAEMNAALEWLYEKFLCQRSLLGTPESCADLVTRLGDIGVQEIACLVDFGPTAQAILGSLPHLCDLKNRFQAPVPHQPRDPDVV
jgi:natural product biosynthesis luciferase-like monooxygenase protein